MRCFWLAFAIAVGGASAPAAAQDKPRIDTMICGGEIAKAKIDRFFATLSRGLAEGREAKWFDRFVKYRFGVVRNGRYAAYDLGDIAAVTPRFVGTEDWRQIAKRGAKRLERVGYRGCMYDNGKAWFEATENGLRLITINHDMAWVDPGRSD